MLNTEIIKRLDEIQVDISVANRLVRDKFPLSYAHFHLAETLTKLIKLREELRQEEWLKNPPANQTIVQ